MSTSDYVFLCFFKTLISRLEKAVKVHEHAELHSVGCAPEVRIVAQFTWGEIGVRLVAQMLVRSRLYDSRLLQLRAYFAECFKIIHKIDFCIAPNSRYRHVHGIFP